MISVRRLPRPSSVTLRRLAAVSAFVALWMACGWLFRLDPNGDLLVGVPLTIFFQRVVRRQPLRALWVREAPPFRLGRRGIVVAVALAVVPFLGLAGTAAEADITGALFNLCSVGGAIGAAYALRSFRRKDLRPLLLCLAATTAIDALQWSLFLGFGLVAMHPVDGGAAARVVVGVFSLVQYVAVVFAMEEVSFRMLDGHLYENPAGRGAWSAVFISAVWGLWHLTSVEELSWATVGLLLFVHVPYGVCLSLFWRRSGNLLVPGLCHALGDAFRNAIVMSE